MISKVTNNAFNLDPAETWPATACSVVVVFVCLFCFFVFFFSSVDHLPDSFYSYKWLKRKRKWILSNLNGIVDC